MKQILHKLALAMATMFAAITASAYDFEVEGIYYNVLSLEDMTCEVVNKGKNIYGNPIDPYKGDVVIPEEVSYNNRTFSVAAIGDGAFSQCDKLEAISIPKSVKSIGKSAFYRCSKLTDVNIPNSVTSIGSMAFEDCRSLESIVLPNSITIIEDYTFASCENLKNVTIPESVTSIEHKACSYCLSLENVTIPNSVTSIEPSVFLSCSSLKSVIISNNLEYIPFGLFEDCEMLKILEIPSSVNRICQFVSSNGYDGYHYPLPSSLDKLSIVYSPEILYAGWVSDYYGEFIPGDWRSKSIKELYINRIIEGEMYLKDLEKLELGESMQAVNIKNLDKQNNLISIESHALTPPTLPQMTNAQYMNVSVIVPEEALEAYKADQEWGKFWNLQGSNVEDVKINVKKEVIGRYDMNGRAVSEDYQGLVIVRFSDGTYKKMLNRKK